MGATTATNQQFSRETPAKKGFFGSVIDQSNNNLGGTPGSKLQRPGLTSHKSSHSAIKMNSTAASNTLTGQGKQQPNVGRVNAGGAGRSNL